MASQFRSIWDFLCFLIY